MFDFSEQLIIYLQHAGWWGFMGVLALCPFLLLIKIENRGTKYMCVGVVLFATSMFMLPMISDFWTIEGMQLTYQWRNTSRLLFMAIPVLFKAVGLIAYAFGMALFTWELIKQHNNAMESDA